MSLQLIWILHVCVHWKRINDIYAFVIKEDYAYVYTMLLVHLLSISISLSPTSGPGACNVKVV